MNRELEQVLTASSTLVPKGVIELQHPPAIVRALATRRRHPWIRHRMKIGPGDEDVVVRRLLGDTS